MSIKERATSSRDDIRSKGAEWRGSPAILSRENWVSSVWSPCPDHMYRGLHVKPVGERSAGNPHVAFDERGEETERWSMPDLSHRASPRLYHSDFKSLAIDERGIVSVGGSSISLR